MRKKTLLITGGHPTPALAIIEEVKKSRDWHIVWVGRKFAMEGETIPSLEYETIPKLGIPFFNLETGRIQRKWTPWTILSLLRIPGGFLQAFFLVLRIKPKVILSFGGYLSLPIVISGWILRVPTIIHEQTTTSGLANRIGALFAKNIAVSYQSSLIEFPHQKTVLTGNPLRRSILEIKRRMARPPLILVTGGEQGAQTINQVMEKIISRLLTSYQLIHQTGYLDYEKFVAKQKKLNPKMGRRYRVLATIPPKKFAQILSRAALLIGRAGANTVTEIAAVGVPAILIPIPWSERGEQEKNARMLEGIGLAKVLPQDDITAEILFMRIKEMMANPPQVRAIRAAKNLVHKNAAKLLVEMIAKYME